MNALVTGITGFVGSHLAEHLLSAGDRVLGVSRSGRWSRDFELPAEIIDWDLATDEPTPRLLETVENYSPDVIYHLAGLSIPADCGGGEPTPAAWRTNVEGTRRVLELSRSLKRPPRIVFAGTSHVYRGVGIDSPPVDESAPCEPRTAYGKTKFTAGQLCLEAANRDGLRVVVARLFPLAGPRQDPRLMLAEWARQFAAGRGEIVVGNLDVDIDLLDVRDGVRALRLLGEGQALSGVFNVGSGVRRTTGEVFELLRRCTGRSPTVRRRHSERRSDPIAAIGRLTVATGWRPEIPLEQTIADVWDYWRRRAAIAERMPAEESQAQTP